MAKLPPSHVLLLVFAALLASFPLFLYGPSCGHDSAFHLLSWQDAAAQFAHGTLHPRWAFLPAWGAGEPRFLFYPPLSWTLGGLLTLLSAHLSGLIPALTPDRAFALVPAVFTWLSLAAAGLSMAFLARRYTSAATATLAGTLYLSNPYTLFTAYERTAFAELLAAAWLPLLFAAILPSPVPSFASTARTHRATPPLSLPATALPLALLWLTNAPAAVLGSYSLALVLLLRCTLLALQDRRAALALALRSLAAAALGLALAAFYIVPAALDRKWVTIGLANVIGLRPRDNTLFHHIGDPAHDQVLHTASLLALALILVTLLASAVLARRSPRSTVAAPSQLLVCLAALTLSALVLLTPVSLPLWDHVPQLAFVQFPWRLCIVLAPAATLALALLLPRLQLSGIMLAAPALTLVLLASLPAASHFRLSCDPEDRAEATAHLAAALLHHRPIADLPDEAPDLPTDEYTPVTADNDAFAPAANPAVRVLPASAPDDAPPPPGAVPALVPLRFDLALQTPARVVLNLRNFPLWSVQNNGSPITVFIARDDGLLAFALPAGANHLTLSLRHSPTEVASGALSLAALLLWLALAKPARTPAKDS